MNKRKFLILIHLLKYCMIIFTNYDHAKLCFHNYFEIMSMGNTIMIDFAIEGTKRYTTLFLLRVTVAYPVNL